MPAAGEVRFLGVEPLDQESAAACPGSKGPPPCAAYLCDIRTLQDLWRPLRGISRYPSSPEFRSFGACRLGCNIRIASEAQRHEPRFVVPQAFHFGEADCSGSQLWLLPDSVRVDAGRAGLVSVPAMGRGESTFLRVNTSATYQ